MRLFILFLLTNFGSIQLFAQTLDEQRTQLKREAESFVRTIQPYQNVCPATYRFAQLQVEVLSYGVPPSRITEEQNRLFAQVQAEGAIGSPCTIAMAKENGASQNTPAYSGNTNNSGALTDALTGGLETSGQALDLLFQGQTMGSNADNAVNEINNIITSQKPYTPRSSSSPKPYKPGNYTQSGSDLKQGTTSKPNQKQ